MWQSIARSLCSTPWHRPPLKVTCGSWSMPGGWLRRYAFGIAWSRSSTYLCPIRSQSGQSLGYRPCEGQSAQHKIVQGAKTTVEAFSFHGWGGGPSEERWSGRVLTQQMRGRATGLHRGPWTFSSSICWRRTSQPRIFARVSGTQHCSLHPLPLGVPHWQRWLYNGGSGSWVRVFGLTPLQMCCHSPWAHCQEHGNSPGVLSMVGWLCQGLARGSAYRLPADGVGRHRVGFVRHATSRFARLVWGRHSGPSAVTTTLVTRPTTLKSQLSGQARGIQTSSGCWFCRGAIRSLMPILQMGLMMILWGANDHRSPVLCAGDGRVEGDSASSSSGWRGPQHGSLPTEDVEEWSPMTAIEILNATKLSSWRDAHGLQDDGDFAFRWTSHVQAVAEAGHLVAHAWLQVRAEQDGQLLPAASRLVEGLPKPVPSSAPPRQPGRKIKWSRKRKGVGLRRNLVDSADVIQQRVDALARELQVFGAIRPAGVMSHRLHDEWSSSVLRLAQRLVTKSEPITVVNALRTSRELTEFMKARGRPPHSPDRVDLDAFLFSKTATSAPSRSLASLKWLNTNGQLQWDVNELTVPPQTNPRQKKGQAPVITPPMLPFLEEQAEAMCLAGDEKWTCLLAGWVIATGCLRHKHLVRTTPRRVSLSTFHGLCHKGKQKHTRAGFHFSIPGAFSSGFPWTKHWLEAWQRLDETKRASAGLCFAEDGSAWTIGEVNTQIQWVFREHLQDPTALTTYSFRRWAPTFGQLLKLTPLEMNALGDWQERSDTPKAAKMPLHYSGAKYAEAMRMKHLLVLCQSAVCDYEAWEVIPASELRRAAEEGRGSLDKPINRDSHTVWAAPISPADAAAHLRVSQSLVDKAKALRDKGRKAAAARAMPTSVQGKVLSAFMKNGVALCGGYQVGLCDSPGTCGGEHKCAVLLKQGRVCGGRHRADECMDKRAMAPEAMPSKPASSPAPVGPRPSGKIAAKKRPRSEPVQPGRRPAPPQPALPVPSSLPIAAADSVRSAGNAAELEQVFDRLATTRGRTAQAPTCIYTHSSGGKLWLAGLPVAGTREHFPAVSLQVKCFGDRLEAKGGVTISNATLVTIALTDMRQRDGQWKEHWPLIRQSIHANEEVLLHCMAGRHRAAGLAILVRALLSGTTIAESHAVVKGMRDIEFENLIAKQHVSNWIHQTYRASYVGPPLPPAIGYISTLRSRLHIMTAGGAPLCSHKQNVGRAAERLVNPITTPSLLEAMAWGREFCGNCMAKAPAGLRAKILQT